MKSQILQVLEVIERCPSTSADIADRIGLPRNQVSSLLCSLSDHGAVRRTGNRKHGNTRARPSIVWEATGKLPPSLRARGKDPLCAAAAVVRKQARSNYRRLVHKVGPMEWSVKGRIFGSLFRAHGEAYAITHGIKP